MVASFQVLPGSDFQTDEGVASFTTTYSDDSTRNFVASESGDIANVFLEIGSVTDGGGQISSTWFLQDVDGLNFLGNEATNEVLFWGDAADASIELGDGGDSAIFFEGVENTTIDFGGADGDVDEVVIVNPDEVDNLTITGADDGDLLFVGGQEYVFDSGSGGFVDGDGNLFEDDEIKYLLGE